MSEDREPITIFPVVMDFTEGPYTDFRPTILPADAVTEVEVVESEEAADPKEGSAQEPADSSGSPKQTEPRMVTPVPPPAPGVTSSPRD